MGGARIAGCLPFLRRSFAYKGQVALSLAVSLCIAGGSVAAAGVVTLYDRPSVSDAEAGYLVDSGYLYLADGFKSLIVEGGTWNGALNTLYAGYSTTGANLTGYSLTVEDGATFDNYNVTLCGAYGENDGTKQNTMSGNQLNIDGGSITARDGIALYGSYIAGGSWTTGDTPNAVNISGGTLTSTDRTYGRISIFGIDNDSAGAAVTGGAVNITGGVVSASRDTGKAIRIGGIRNEKSASSGGSVSISGAWDNVNGAPTTQLLVTDVDSPIFTIYAADTGDAAVQATGGSVTLSGHVGFQGTLVNLYGRGSGATGTGNTLHIGTEADAWRGYWKGGDAWNLNPTNRVGTVNNFDTVALYRVTFSANTPALQTESLSYFSGDGKSGLANITLDLTKLSFVDASGAAYAPEAGDSMTLLSAGHDLTGLKLAYDAATQETPVALTAEGVACNTRELVDGNENKFYSNEGAAALTNESKAVTYTVGTPHIALTDKTGTAGAVTIPSPRPPTPRRAISSTTTTSGSPTASRP